LDSAGLVSNIVDAVLNIDAGRKGFATRGKEQAGRLSYEKGIGEALSTFQEATNQKSTASAGPQALILAEYTFLSQEFQLCDISDKDSRDSLTKAIQLFDDAFLAL